jgi:hypothetical protein
MTTPFPFPESTEDADGPDAWGRALLDHQLAELGRLAAMGMDIAGAVHRQATAEADAASVADLQHAALNFSRVARAVRLTFALQSRLVADFKGRSPVAEAGGSDERTVEVRWIGQLSPAETARRSRLQDVVRGVAEGEALDAETVERLVREAVERIEDDGVFGDIMTRPFGEIVALICRDLGLKPDWDALSSEVWAQEEIRTRAKGSPFAASPASGGERRGDVDRPRSRSTPGGPEGAFRRANDGNSGSPRSP